MKKSILVWTVVLSLIFNMVCPVFADEFWNLYQLGEAKKAQGDMIGAIDAWKGVVKLYKDDVSVTARTRSAVYWTKIADAYNSMGWFGEAQQAYKNVEYFWNLLGETDSAWGPNRTATRLKTDLRVYAKTTPQSQQTYAKFEPVSGIYFGAPFDKDSAVGDDLSKVEDVYGKPHTAFLMYIRWGDPIQKWTANQARQLGAGLQIAWEPPADMNKIKYSDVLNFAKQLKALEVPIFLRFACEMNEISNPWGQTSPKLYKEKFRLVADTMHAEASNVAMVWAPLYVPMDVIPSFYPGDEYVDWVGVDAYTDRYYIGDPSYSQLIQDLYYQGYYANPLDRFEYIYNTYSSKKPIFIAETGVQNYAMNTGEDFSSWAVNNMRRLYEYIPMVYPRIKAIFYFNVDSSLVPGLGLKQNYSLSRSNMVMNTYKEVIKNPYYLSNLKDAADFMYKPLEEITFNKNTNIELSTYVKIIDPFVKRVEYWIDGKKVGDISKIPFTKSFDLSGLSKGQHILRVDVYNSQNELNARRIYNLNVEEQKISFQAQKVLYVPRHIILRDINNHWAKSQIEKLVSLWSIDGYDDETFKPQKQITRAEFYKLLSTSLGTGLQTNSNRLSNISSTHWAKGLLEGGVQLGIINPDYYNGNFVPDQAITRGEMAMLAVRALNNGKEEGLADTKFDDNKSIPKIYRGYISKAYNIGVIDGFGDNTFRVDGNATRAQAVSMILRAVEYQNK